MQKILCFYSGSLTAAGTLWQILSNPDYLDLSIHVHHIRIINYTQNEVHKYAASKATLALLAEQFQRKFIYTENRVDFSCLPLAVPLPADADIVAFMAGTMLNMYPAIKYIAIGHATHSLPQQLSKSAQITKALAMYRTRQSAAQYINPLVGLNNEHLSMMLPQNILKLVCQEGKLPCLDSKLIP